MRYPRMAAIVAYVIFSAFFFHIFGSAAPDSTNTLSLEDCAQLQKPITELDRIVVTASKRSMRANMVVEDVKVITADEAKASGAFTVMELLDGIPGVDIDPARTQTNIKLNGMPGSYVKLLIDGIPVTGDVGGGFPLENLAMGDIRCVEVLSGAASTVYGTDAIGGVVNIMTDQPGVITPLRVRTSYSYLNNDSLSDWGGKNRFDISMAHGNQFLAAHGYYGFNLDNGISRYIADDFGIYKKYSYPNADQQKGGLKLTFFPADDLTLKPSASYSTSSIERLSGTNLAYLQTTYRTINLAGSYNPDQRFGIDGYSSMRNLNHLNRTILQGATTGTKDSRTNFVDYEGELRFNLNNIIKAGGNDHIIAGVNILHESIESDNVRRDVARTQGGFFATGYWESTTTLPIIVNPSIRVTLSENEDQDASHTTLSDLSPKLGLRLNDVLLKGVYLSASYGHAYSVPRFKNMYYSFNMGNSMWIEGNEELKPEKSHQFYSGTGYRRDKLLEISVNSFYNRLDDMIVLQSVRRNDGSQVYRGMNGELESQLASDETRIPEKTYINALRGYSWGVSAEMQLRPLSWTTFSLAATRTYSAAQDDEGKMLEEERYSPYSVHLRATLSFEQIRKSMPILNVTVIWKDRQIDSQDTSGIDYLNSFTKINIQLTKSVFNSISVRLGVDNLLGYERAGYAGLDYGRTYLAAIEINFNDIAQIVTSLKPNTSTKE